MTVLTNTRRREYPGNGVTTVFSGPRIFLETQLAAYLVNQATGAVTTLTRGPDYTISSIGFPQSIVTLAVAPTAGLTLLLLRTLPSQQPYSIKNQGAFFADIHEDALDYRAMFDQQMEDALSLALRVPETTLNFDAILPQPVVGDALRPVVLNPTGTGLEFGDFAAGDLLLRPNLASNSPAQGASLVAISDQDALFDASTVEGALAELANKTASNKPEDLQQVIRNMRDGLTVKVVCLGDSITYGQLDTGGQAATPYPARLQALLQAYYDNGNITVVNAGIGGNTVQSMINRFNADVRSEDPDLIIFNGGTNDSIETNNVSLDNYSGDLETIFNLSRPTPMVVFGITPRFKEHQANLGGGVIDFYRKTLRDATANRGICYVDTFKRLHDLYRTRAWAAGLFSSDGSHYSEEGYRYIGDTIFADAFANDDLYIKPGQFKDARGQWISTSAAASDFGGSDMQDANSLVLTGSSVGLFLYVEDWVECALVLHAVIDRTSASNQALTLSNNGVTPGGVISVNLSPNTAGGVAFFVNDYAIPTVRLRPGLNYISLSTATSARISGFSVLQTDDPQYLDSVSLADRNRSREFWTSTRYRTSTQSFRVLRDGILTVSNSASELIEPYFTLLYDNAYDTARWRIRATVFPGTKFYLGQQSNASGVYSYVYSVHFDGTNCIVNVRDHAGVDRLGASVAVAVAAGGADVVIDIKTTATGWSIWVGAVLIFSDNIPLSLGPVFVSASTTKRSYWNPPIKKGPSCSDTGVLVGEQWRTFTGAAPTLKLVDDAAATRTLTYT